MPTDHEPWLEQLKKAGATVRLEPERKAFLRAQLAMRMARTPVVSAQSSWRLLMRPFPVLAGFLVVVLLGGGTAFASEYSVPGDILYPVKVGVVEEVRSLAARTPEAKASWESERAARRLSEANTLIARNELSSDTEEELRSGFARAADAATMAAAEVISSGHEAAAAVILARFEANLSAHKNVLARLSPEDAVPAAAASAPALMGASAPEIALPGESFAAKAVPDAAGKRIEEEETPTVRTEVRDRLAKVRELRAEAEIAIAAPENQAALRAVAETRLRDATEVIGEARKTVVRERKNLGEVVAKRLTNRLEKAARILTEGRARAETSTMGEALRLGDEAAQAGAETKAITDVVTDPRRDARVNVFRGDDTEDDETKPTPESVPSESKTGSSDDAGDDAVVGQEGKPPIVDHFACSDYCPGPAAKYTIKIYQGVTDPEECKKIGGTPFTYYGWGRFDVCAAGEVDD